MTTTREWRKAGGSEVLVWRFFERACAAAGGRKAARALAEVAARGPREVASLDAIGRAVGGGLEETKKVAAALRDQLLLRPAENGYRLAAEWARRPACAYTGEMRGRAVAARLLLRAHMESGRPALNRSGARDTPLHRDASS